MDRETRQCVLDRYVPDDWSPFDNGPSPPQTTSYEKEAVIPVDLTVDERGCIAGPILDFKVRYHEGVSQLCAKFITSLICDPYAFVLIEIEQTPGFPYCYSLFNQQLEPVLQRVDYEDNWFEMFNPSHQRLMLKYIV